MFSRMVRRCADEIHAVPLFNNAVQSILATPVYAVAPMCAQKRYIGSLTGDDMSVFRGMERERQTKREYKQLMKFKPIPQHVKDAHRTEVPFDEWDGFGSYHFKKDMKSFPCIKMLADIQNRRIFAKHADHLTRLEAVQNATFLPKDLRQQASQEILHLPRAAHLRKLKRRCAVTGKLRGIFHQYRVSRHMFRAIADANQLSGVQRAFWTYNVHIKPK